MFGKKTVNEIQQEPDMELFTVYDSKSGLYDLPALSPNKNVLLRDVINMLRDPAQAKNKYLTNAEDFAIFKIGTFNKKTGEIGSQHPEHVANMHELRTMAEPGALSST